MSTRNHPSHPDVDPTRVDRDWMAEDHDYVIYRSTVPIDVDGYKLDEFCRLECPHCHASAALTERPSRSIDELEHALGCPNLED